jgi:hypothetical protein
MLNLAEAKNILPTLDTAALRQTIDVLLREDYTGITSVINAIGKASYDMSGDIEAAAKAVPFPDSARKHYEGLTVATVHENPFRYVNGSLGTVHA